MVKADGRVLNISLCSCGGFINPSEGGPGVREVGKVTCDFFLMVKNDSTAQGNECSRIHFKHILLLSCGGLINLAGGG